MLLNVTFLPLVNRLSRDHSCRTVHYQPQGELQCFRLDCSYDSKPNPEESRTSPTSYSRDCSSQCRKPVPHCGSRCAWAHQHSKCSMPSPARPAGKLI